MNRGPLLESFNWAKVFNLPVLFVCEDNKFAATTRTKTMTAGARPARRAPRASACRPRRSTATTSSPSTRSPPTWCRRSAPAAGRCCCTPSPIAIRGHLATDPANYRKPEEVLRHALLDPIIRCEAWLKHQGIDEDAIARETEGDRRPDRGAPSPPPRTRPSRHPRIPCRRAGRGSADMARMTYAEAAQARRSRRRWGATDGLGARRGSGPRGRRRRPVSRDCRRSSAATASSTRRSRNRPSWARRSAPRSPARGRWSSCAIADFGICAADEIVNQAAKIRYMIGGQARAPLVIRQTDRHPRRHSPRSIRNRPRRGGCTSPASSSSRRRRPPTITRCSRPRSAATTRSSTWSTRSCGPIKARCRRSEEVAELGKARSARGRRPHDRLVVERRPCRGRGRCDRARRRRASRPS